MAGKSMYDQEIADRICELLATTEHGLKTVLAQIAEERGDAPCVMTVWAWEKARPEFREQMKEARDMQAQLLHDEAQEVARNPLMGIIEKTVIKPDGREIHTTCNDNVERSKLLVQTLLKRAGQLAPSKYGEKVQAEISGELAIKRVVSDL
jgi:hypothetical protein